MTAFAPIRSADGYLPLEDYGLIGDGATTALVGRNGSLDWLCLPRFDSPPLFGGILDADRGGSFAIALEGLTEARQEYVANTGVLITELRCPTGAMRLTDALLLRSGANLSENIAADRRELMRRIDVLHGSVRLKIRIEPRGGATVERRGGGLRLRCPLAPELDIQLRSTAPLDGLRTTHELMAGNQLTIRLRWGHRPNRFDPIPPDEMLDSTIDSWRRWVQRLEYDGPQAPLVRRSAITLKLLDYLENGALVAAPTSSLPEIIGGTRNWDYRYSWVRDAAFSVYALQRIGLMPESWGFLAWVLDIAERDGHPSTLYNLDGLLPPAERIDPDLEGYRRSQPVRWGNAAADQVQNDVYGEIVDCAYQWSRRGGAIDEPLWQGLAHLVETARQVWRTPDQGIWEVRTNGRAFTYSVALCQVAIDRGARLARRYNLPADIAAWRADAERIRQVVLEDAWNPDTGTLTQQLGGDAPDASLLALPLRRVVPPDHPRMIATTNAIRERLGAGNGLLYRYLINEAPDGIAGHEGAFLLCSFWLVDNLAGQGRLEEAQALYESLCNRASPLGLLPEEIDPSTGRFLGNFPQAFSHVGLISSGVNLAGRLTAARGGATRHGSP